MPLVFMCFTRFFNTFSAMSCKIKTHFYTHPVIKSVFISVSFSEKVLFWLSLKMRCWFFFLSNKVSFDSSSFDADEISLFSALSSHEWKFYIGGKYSLCHSSVICNWYLQLTVSDMYAWIWMRSLYFYIFF